MRERSIAVLALFLAMELAAMTVSTQGLLPHNASGDIRVTAPSLHFLTGKSLSRLRDGAAVPFDFQLVIAAGSKSNAVARALERFTVSYDVWEEKFSVVRARDLRKSGMRLSVTGAESWCLDNIFVPSGNLPPDQPLWARLEVRTGEAKDPLGALPNSGLNLTTLIEIFSRPTRPQQDRWLVESASPFQLASLKP
jgi:hypothetical protein